MCVNPIYIYFKNVINNRFLKIKIILFLLIGILLLGCEKENIPLKKELKNSFDIEEEETKDLEKSSSKIQEKIEIKIKNWLDNKA